MEAVPCMMVLTVQPAPGCILSSCRISTRSNSHGTGTSGQIPQEWTGGWLGTMLEAPPHSTQNDAVHSHRLITLQLVLMRSIPCICHGGCSPHRARAAGYDRSSSSFVPKNSTVYPFEGNGQTDRKKNHSSHQWGLRKCVVK
jgi:hypothetical protein